MAAWLLTVGVGAEPGRKVERKQKSRTIFKTVVHIAIARGTSGRSNALETAAMEVEMVLNRAEKAAILTWLTD